MTAAILQRQAVTWYDTMRCDNIIIFHGISISLFVATLHDIAREGDGTSQQKLPIQRH